MRRLTLACSAFLLLAPALAEAVQLERYMMTKPKPPDCSTATASWPTPYTSFPVTDAAAYLWFYVTGANAGDVAESAYYDPSGNFYAAPSGAFDPLPSGGNWCFTDAAFHIAGYPPASLPGKWTVTVKWNGTVLFTLNFYVGAAPSSYGQNLIQNGDAEASNGTPDCAVVAVPNWAATGEFSICGYGTSGSPTASSPGPPNRGNNFFFGGYTGTSTGTQRIDLSWAAADIDRGTVTYTLSGYVGGYNGQDDSATVKALFRATAASSPTQAVIGPVLSSERSGTTGLLLKSATGTVPAGTRLVDVVQEMTRASGSANDGYTDSLSLVLTQGGGGGGSLQLTINQALTTNCPSNQLIVSVTDAQGNPVTGLTSSNFTLQEGGQNRAITVTPVSSGSSGPLSLALLIDISSSLHSDDLASEKAAAKQLIAQLGASDAVALYSFETSVRLVENFTTDKARLNAAIDGLSTGSNTALYQAIQTAAQALAARSGRKAMVLMTDGDDTVGGASLTQAIDAASQAGAPVFPVGFGTVDESVLAQIASATGGVFAKSATAADLQRILQVLGQMISSQYEISYTSGTPASDNTLQVTVSSGGQTATATRTVAACSGGGGTCDYFVQPLSQSVGAGETTGLVQVFTATTCAWTAASNASWIAIEGGASGSGNGAVSYRVAANTGSAARTGTLTVAGRTVTVTQAAAAACAFALTPTSNAVAALGGSSSTRLTTSAGCAWTAASNAAWITITSAASGSGSAAVNYTVAANTSTSSRTGTLTIAGLTFTVTQAGGASDTGPTIAQGGIVNAASNRAGAVARGSFFTIYGRQLGPSQYAQATSYPIPDSMSGVVVTITQGSTTRRAYLHFVSATQINGIVPSDAPLGDVQFTVTYQRVASASGTATIVDTAFGIFSTAGGSGPGILQNYVSVTEVPLNMGSKPAKPGQIVILWGTGLGPIATPDNQPPPGGDLAVPVEISVGGKSARKLYSGRAPSFAAVDNIYFEVPADAPAGCSVPVQVKAGTRWSNTVRMAISSDGRRCEDTANPFANVTTAGGRTGVIGLLRVGFNGQLEAGAPAVDATLAVGLGVFTDTPAGGELAFSPFLNLPPQGSCVATNQQFDLGAVLGGGSALNSTTGRMLDAGTVLTVTGPKGSANLQQFGSSGTVGPYLGLLGGNLPISGASAPPLFLDPGAYTIRGTGGVDVGAFTASLSLPGAITWTNRSQIATIDRAVALPVTWSGGDASQTVLIVGASTNQQTKNSGGFLCLAPAAAGSFTVPASALADLPPTTAQVGLSDSVGALAIAALPLSSPPSFTATGLDHGYIFHATISAKTVTVK